MSNLRAFERDSTQYAFYKQQHANQTVDFVRSKLDKYKRLDNCKLKMADALDMLDSFVDPSDPDVNETNSYHAYQTANHIRLSEPDNLDLQITGLIHDVGKILYRFGEPTWAVVGDTFPVGCAYSQNIVFHETLRDNPDYDNPTYQSKYGIYGKNAGLENLLMSFGHDEYLHIVLKGNSDRHHLPEKFLKVIRFHSFYPWHTHGDYAHLMSDSDSALLIDVQEFNKHDLYSKEDDFQLTPEIKGYFRDLLMRYFPVELSW